MIRLFKWAHVARAMLFNALLLSCSASCASDNMVVTANNQSSSFKVSLPGNPTTGYRWVVNKYDMTRFDAPSSSYVASSNKLMGAGGVYTFTFKLKPGLKNPKQTKVSLSYGRSWEKNSADKKDVTVIFAKPASTSSKK